MKALIITAALLSLFPALRASCVLIDAGEIREGSAIVIPDRANSVEKTAAKELKYHLEKACGVKLPILTESRAASTITSGFKLGRVGGAPDTTGTAPGTFELKFRDGFLYISGHDGAGAENSSRTPAGTLFGVYHYLRHELGVRWLWPGASGEFIPHTARVELDAKLDGVYPPAFRFAQATALQQDADSFRWGRRVMHMDASHYMVHAGTPGHAFGNWSERYGSKHPEWFAMNKDGQRNTRPHAPMCISSPGFHEQIVKLWDAAQKKSGRKLFINVKENDTQSRCVCPECLRRDGPDERGPTGRYALYRNVGERYAKFYRAVREKAAEIDPEANVSFYAYQSYFYAPRQTKLDRHFYAGLVPDIPFPRRPEYNEWLRREYRAWQDSGATFYLRPNYFLGGYCMPEVWYDQYAAEFKFLKELGCIGVAIDGPGGMWATRGLDYYVMARLCVEPDADPEKIAGEYCSGFGPASAEVRAYFDCFRDYLRDNTARINDIYESSQRKWYFHGFHYAAYAHRIFPVEVLKKGRTLLDAAALKTTGDTGAAAKVDFLRQGLEYAIASVKCAAVFDTPETGNELRKQTWDRLLELRAKLPPYAVNGKLLDRIEKNVWQVASFNDVDAQALPEQWFVMPDPKDQGEKLDYPNPRFDATAWKKASTWKPLEAQGWEGYVNMWYRVRVHIAEKSSEKVILRLGAVDESCDVWVNGRKIGSFRYDSSKDPQSWQKPLEFDITPAVKFGADNDICIKLINQTGGGGLWKPSCLVYRGKE